MARRIRRDRRRASEELGPVFDHIEERFYDADLTLDSMERGRLAPARALQ
ncbi:MAG: hypothetical protein GY842_14925 [bacterium]|nr:hypothetical protein [bacterium]